MRYYELDTTPFIIWTLQRTGGTNLAHRLMELSRLPKTDHEPFLVGRALGYVTSEWVENQDGIALKEAVGSVCAKGVLIKHCVEVVPWDVTESLVDASISSGYKHLFLYRRNAVERLLSLYSAMKSGRWGPDMKLFVQMTGANNLGTKEARDFTSQSPFTGENPAEALAEHEAWSVEAMLRTWWRLRLRGEEPVAVAYEDIYCASNQRRTVSLLSSVLDHVGLRVSSGVAEWVRSLLSYGLQGEREDYNPQDFPFLLAKKLELVPKFLPERTSMMRSKLCDFISDDTISDILRSRIFYYAFYAKILRPDDIEIILSAKKFLSWDVRRCLLYKALVEGEVQKDNAARIANSLISDVVDSTACHSVERYNLASLEELAGDLFRASAGFYELLSEKSVPHLHAGCRFHLGRIALYRGLVGEALEHLKFCVELEPKHLAAVELLSKLEGKEISG